MDMNEFSWCWAFAMRFSEVSTSSTIPLKNDKVSKLTQRVTNYLILVSHFALNRYCCEGDRRTGTTVPFHRLLCLLWPSSLHPFIRKLGYCLTYLSYAPPQNWSFPWVTANSDCLCPIALVRSAVMKKGTAIPKCTSFKPIFFPTIFHNTTNMLLI